jgi:Tfp pilus assembly protein PilX
MASTDEYRRLAAECLRIAHESQNPKDRALLLRMAESWMRLAEQSASRHSPDVESATRQNRERSTGSNDNPTPDHRGTEGS